MIKFTFIPDPLIECDSENVYYPQEDTYLLLDYFKKCIKDSFFDGIEVNQIEYILDMGTGTGILAIFFQYLKSKNEIFNPQIIASDILEESLICAKKNETLNNFHNEIVFLQSDLFNNFPENLKSRFNIMIFNPPYLPSSNLINKSKYKKKIDYSWDGGAEGNEILSEFMKNAKNFLNLNKPHFIYYLTSSRTKLDKLNKFLIELGFTTEIVDKKHIFFEDIILNKAKLI